MNRKQTCGQGLHRLLAVFLCAMLCACLFPAHAFAADGDSLRGNLLLIADSSDGHVDGFSVMVKSVDGAHTQTFAFGEAGQFEMKGLPAGAYTVSAISNDASRGYIMPDVGEVQITGGETETVHFFYERYRAAGTPEETPQTGDSGQAVWILLFALSLVGCGAGVILYRMKGGAGKMPALMLLLLSIGLCVGSTFMLVREAGRYAEGAQAYTEAASLAAEQSTHKTEQAAPEASGTASEAQPDPVPEIGARAMVQAVPIPSVPLPAVDFAALREKGPGVTAWLTLPDTAINYPVAQAQDNEYYLDHLYDGTENKAGCLFLDCENAPDFSDRNTIIYGHNMRDGSMFASLLRYAGQDYYNAHPNMLLVTPEGGFLVELFSAFEAAPDEAAGGASPWALDWESDRDYAAWLADMRGRSLFQTDVPIASGDRVITLSTCTDSGDSRFIVMGRLLPITEN